MADHSCKDSRAKIKVKIMEGDRIVEKEIVLSDTKTIFRALAKDHARDKFTAPP